jgi:hypothetical protein
MEATALLVAVDSVGVAALVEGLVAELWVVAAEVATRSSSPT